MKKLISLLIVTCFIINITGCATVTGPSVSSEEIQKVKEELMVKSLAYRIKQTERLEKIGDSLIKTVPKDDIKTPPKPFLGIICLPVDKYAAKLYNLDVNKGVVVVIVKENSPAKEIGLQPGDLLVSIKKSKITNINRFQAIGSSLKIGEQIPIEIKRGGQALVFDTKVAETALKIPIIMIDAQEVNAATNGQLILVTQGLVNFAKSDDEIAAVLSHELAHAVRGHVAKAQGGQILTLIAALALGIAAETNAPGSGNSVMRGVGDIGNIFNASYSRDLEREADYFGAKFFYYAGYNVETFATVEERFAVEIPATMIQHYLSTHPSSPERVARVRKIIEELKAGSSQAIEQKE